VNVAAGLNAALQRQSDPMPSCYCLDTELFANGSE